jgi:ribonuclease I
MYILFALVLLEANFTIHGVWPEYSNGSWPQYCHRCTWQPPQGELLDEMLRFWPNLWVPPPRRRAASEELWHHEYCRHGTCVPKLVNATQYYVLALSLYQDIRPNRLLPWVNRTTPLTREDIARILGVPGYPVYHRHHLEGIMLKKDLFIN